MDHSPEAYYRTDLMTITRHVLNEQSKHPEARGDFTILLNHIVLGCKYVCSAVNKVFLILLLPLCNITINYVHFGEHYRHITQTIYTRCMCIHDVHDRILHYTKNNVVFMLEKSILHMLIQKVSWVVLAALLHVADN